MLKIDPLNFFYCIILWQFLFKVWNFWEDLFSKIFNLEPSWLEVENISPDHFYCIFMWQFLPKWHNLPLMSLQIFLAFLSLNFSWEISCILIARKKFIARNRAMYSQSTSISGWFANDAWLWSTYLFWKPQIYDTMYSTIYDKIGNSTHHDDNEDDDECT